MKATVPVYLGCHVHQLGQPQILALLVFEELQQATWGEEPRKSAERPYRHPSSRPALSPLAPPLSRTHLLLPALSFRATRTQDPARYLNPSQTSPRPTDTLTHLFSSLTTSPARHPPHRRCLRSPALLWALKPVLKVSRSNSGH